MINNIQNLQRIFNILPQRYPFLMVDRVIKADKKEVDLFPDHILPFYK